MLKPILPTGTVGRGAGIRDMTTEKINWNNSFDNKVKNKVNNEPAFLINLLFKIIKYCYYKSFVIIKNLIFFNYILKIFFKNPFLLNT